MGTSYKTRITIDGVVKICKYSKFDGYDAEQDIREFFTECDINKMKDMVRKITPPDDDYVEYLTNKNNIKWDRKTDEFYDENDKRKFFRLFPEFSYSQHISDLLPMIYDGTVTRVPYVDVDEKYLDYVIDVNLDRDEIIVCAYDDPPYTLKLQMLYTDKSTTFIKIEDANYECAACKYKRIQKEFMFCPICGRKLLREIPLPVDWTDEYKEKDYNASLDDDNDEDDE